MVSETIACNNDPIGNKKEFVRRVLSSFMFIPLVALLFFVSHNVFSILCWITYTIIACEIFSPKIEGKFLLRTIALIICFFGISSFVYCLDFFGPLGCVFLICIASFTDVGAYSFGKIFRGPKLCPKISPNKTWAGFFGGIVLANIAFYFLSNVFFQPSVNGSFLPTHFGNFIAVQCIILASVIGDLLESYFKRKIGVKDMGHLFPGHGGILDRLDSLLFASIVFAFIDIVF